VDTFAFTGAEMPVYAQLFSLCAGSV